MGLPAETYITPEDYLRAERQAETKHEYYDGEIFAMAGASETHVSVVSNLVFLLMSQLRKKPCKVYANDLRVRVSETGLYTYPDVVVLCKEGRFDDKQKDTLLNPGVIVEVLSGSTEAYDRGKKFEHYRRVESLTDYILVEQNSMHIEHYRRQDNGWLFTEAKGEEGVIRVENLDCELILAEVYEKIEFPA